MVCRRARLAGGSCEMAKDLEGRTSGVGFHERPLVPDEIAHRHRWIDGGSAVGRYRRCAVCCALQVLRADERWATPVLPLFGSDIRDMFNERVEAGDHDGALALLSSEERAGFLAYYVPILPLEEARRLLAD